MLGSKIRFEGLRGVGTVELDFQENQRVYTLIGANGIGKTKTLEGLFQTLFFTHSIFRDTLGHTQIINQKTFCFSNVKMLEIKFEPPKASTILSLSDLPIIENSPPIVYIAAQNRGFIQEEEVPQKLIGGKEERVAKYLQYLVDGIAKDFSELNMNVDVNLWFTSIAQSANPYQKQEDNREVEIKTVLKLLHEIDEKIDPQFLEISGDGRVSLKIDGQKRELSHLSTGFASILKMLQAIVSGYGYFTNEVQLQNVPGIVLIDEIESHLHLSWQSHIIPLFKRLFPNTTFYITTHSPIVLTQLNEGEAYRLERDSDGVVRTHLIHAPNRAAMVDVLQEAFDVDLNRIKQDSSSPENQKAAKQQLLNLLKTQWGDA